MCAFGAHVVDRHPERNAPDPHPKFRRVGEQVEVAKGAKEALLRHIVDIRWLNERQGDRVHHSLVASGELAEGVARARGSASGSGDELGVG